MREQPAFVAGLARSHQMANEDSRSGRRDIAKQGQRAMLQHHTPSARLRAANQLAAIHSHFIVRGYIETGCARRLVLLLLVTRLHNVEVQPRPARKPVPG